MKTIAGYVHSFTITKELLDTVEIGDFVKINNWKKPMKVAGVSENYFMMTTKNFGKLYYSVCEKILWDGRVRNAMRGGMFHCGDDDHYNFTFPEDITIQEQIDQYLDDFEQKRIELSVRRAVPIYNLYLKKAHD